MKIEDAVRYVCKKYPLPHELSKARLTKIIYLADWESCKRTGAPLTSIEWYFHNFGPYVDDVVDAARASKYLDVIESTNLYGDKKEMIVAKENSPLPILSRQESGILDEVMNATKSMYWKAFIQHVYATPPVAGSDRYTVLNMKHFAKLESKK